MSIDLRELLRFYAEAGVDEALDEASRDRFSEFAEQQNRQAAPTGAAQQPVRSPAAAKGATDQRPATQPARPASSNVAVPDEGQVLLARELADPKVLVALGGPSAKVLIGTPEGIMKLRGNWRVHRTRTGKEIPVMPTLHPAYLLRNPAHKRLAWRDFLEIKARLRAAG